MRARLFIKRLLFPGLDVGLRKRIRLARNFRAGDITTLDAGCGNGAFSFAATELGNRVLGIDSDAMKLARCVEYRNYRGIDPKRCEFQTMSIFDLPNLGRMFDQIICLETLEHITDDARTIRTLASVLAPGGSLHICVPYRLRKPYVGEVISDVEDGGHVRLGYTMEALRILLERERLVIVRRGTLVGFFSIFASNAIHRAGRACQAAGTTVQEIVRLLTLLLLYPLTFLDPLVPSRFLNIYIEAHQT